MPFFLSHPNSQWVFKTSYRLMSNTPFSVFEARISPENSNYLEIVDWQKYQPPRPTVHHLEVIEVEGPARAISIEERDKLAKKE